MSIYSVSSTNLLSRSISNARENYVQLQEQLATGKKSQTYGQMGAQRANHMSMRADITSIDGYRATISQVNININVMNEALGQIRDMAVNTRSDAFKSGFTLQSNGQTGYQTTAKANFSHLVATLNTEINDRHIFSGRASDKVPVSNADHILEGADGKDGFKTVAAQRREADLGSDGRGRLAAPGLAGSTVELAEQAASGPFGFKLASINSSLSGTTANSPAGTPPALSVEFSSTLPVAGETIKLGLDLPDGTKSELVLTATSSAPKHAGEFRIGADENETALNFQSALDTLVKQSAEVDLAAASLASAASDFFDNTPPQRVDGPPFASASALRDGTDSDTITWYNGEVSATPARDSVIAKVDDNIVVGYGMRANEDAFRDVMKNMAMLATETFSSGDENAHARYDAIKYRTADGLNFPADAQSVDNIIVEISTAQVAMNNADERHSSMGQLLTATVEDIENADVYEVSAQLLQLQTQLEASYQVTANLSKLSLVNFI
jgi:flagellin-like hook-associated protein FlgL